MRLLLDSHAFLWFCEGNSRLSAVARAAIEDPNNEKSVSLVTAWEVAIKLGLGKLKLQIPFEELFPGALVANGFRVLTPDFRHFRELLTLPLHHRDPFDCLLIAQAKLDGLTIVSTDPDLPPYGVSMLW
ncbi:MAG TPA: type II toxin-antitoxin system VapC family toxin [Pirellulaceae bacterium]|jgi:PIN domain nuclease of toxin-antitoxin system